LVCFRVVAAGASKIPMLGAFDYIVHDTYYVVATFYLCPLIFFFALVYWLLQKIQIKLNNWLSIAHFVFTSISYVLFFLYIAFTNTEQSFSPRKFEYFGEFAELYFVVGQFLFILHLLTLFVCFLRKK
jgi:heme/copper-type cytochrome/quinol oxidase subunit 1